MFNPMITLTIIVIIAFAGLACYAIWPRSTKNYITKIIPARKKRYVVCHLVFPNKMCDDHNIVRNLQGLTKVGDYSYELKDSYVSFYTKNRAHFILDENNVMPRTYEEQSTEKVIFQAAEIQTALDNTVMDYLFSKKKELLITLLFVLAGACLLAMVYNGYQLMQLKDMLSTTLIQVNAP